MGRMTQFQSTATLLSVALSTLWKWSVPVSRTGPDWTAIKIGNALFPGPALRKRHLVTLRWSKAPITVCESALSADATARKTFPQNLGALFSRPARWKPKELLYHGFIALWRIPAGACRVGCFGQTRPAVYPAPDGAQVASLQSPILRWSKQNLNRSLTPTQVGQRQ
jgi:hypothetical protein